MVRRALAPFVLCAVLLAGCTGDPGVIQYHGDDPGVDTVTILCEEGAQTFSVSVTHRGDAGKMFGVTALTPMNKEPAINQTITLRGPTDMTETFTAPAIQGMWEVVVERLDPFKGNFEVRGGCT